MIWLMFIYIIMMDCMIALIMGLFEMILEGGIIMKDKNNLEPSDYITSVSGSINNDNQPYLDDVEVLRRECAVLSYEFYEYLDTLLCPQCKSMISFYVRMRRTTDNEEYDIVSQPKYCQYCGKKLVKEK